MGKSELMVSSDSDSSVPSTSDSVESVESNLTEARLSEGVDSANNDSVLSADGDSVSLVTSDSISPANIDTESTTTNPISPTPSSPTLSPEEEPQVFYLPTRRPRPNPTGVTFIQRNANGDTWTSHSFLRSTPKSIPEKHLLSPMKSSTLTTSTTSMTSTTTSMTSTTHLRPHRKVTVFRPRNRSSLVTYIRRSDGSTRLRTERDLQRLQRRSADLDAGLEENLPDGGEMTHTEPAAFLIDSLRSCHLRVSNVTQRGLSELSRAPYAFSSEEARQERDERVDREFLERDLRSRNETEWQMMREETLADPSLRLPKDHLSISHVRKNYQVIRRRELRVATTLLQRMNESTCFAQPVQKYVLMAEELGTAQENSWELLRLRLHAHGSEVTRDDLMSTYRNLISSRRGKRQELYQNVFFYSESSQPCDGCVISRRKSFLPQTVYPHHLLIRKFVGDEEVSDVSTSENRSNECEKKRSVVSSGGRCVRRDGSDGYLRLQPSLLAAQPVISLSRVGVIEARDVVRSCWSCTRCRRTRTTRSASSTTTTSRSV